jgi:hypothetical protein
MVVEEDAARTVDVDLDQFGAVGIADTGRKLALEPTPDAADADRIVDDVLRFRLTNRNRW